MPDDRIPEMDEQTRAALLLFNQHLAAEAEAEAASRRLRKAEQAKNDTAARLRKLQEAKAPAEEVAEAEAAYRKALDRWTRLRDGLPEEEESEESEESEEATEAPGAGDGQAEPEQAEPGTESARAEPEPEAGEAGEGEGEAGSDAPEEASEQAS